LKHNQTEADFMKENESSLYRSAFHQAYDEGEFLGEVSIK